MNRILFAALLCIMAVMPCGAALAKVVEVTSPGGIRALLMEDHVLPLMTLRISIAGAGYANDPEDRQGRAALAVGLLNEGAGEYDAAAFKQRLEDRAIEMRASVDVDRASIQLQAVTKHRDEAFRLLGLALSQPRFDADAIVRVKSEMHALRAQSESNPGFRADRAWNALAFPGSGYSYLQYGTEDSAARIQQSDLRDYARKHVTASNLTLSVAGDITASELEDLLDSTFGVLPKGEPQEKPQPLTLENTGKTEIIEMDLPQSTLLFGMEGIPRRDPEYLAAFILNHILGSGSFTSRLMQAVRVEKGLVYGIGTNLQEADRIPLWQGSASTRNEKAGEAIATIRAEVERMRDKGVTQQELDEAKQYLMGAFPLNLDTNGKITAYLNVMQVYGLGNDYLEKRNAYVNAVTLEQVNAMAQRLLNPDRMIVVIAGKPEGMPGSVK